MEDLSKEATKLKWRWAGHVARMGNERWAKKLTEWIPRSHKRTRGRKKIRWYDEMKKNVGPEWQSIARDRQLWEAVVKEISNISEVSRKPYHIKLNKNVTSSSSLPRNSNMEKINNICLDQNVQSEISEDQVGGGLQKCLDIKSNAAASTKSKSTSSLSSIKPASLKAELEKALEDRYGDKLS
ncbi:hypothetical protein M8J77_019174 [Diaphorina citri]|nr:hypothetical protein M8J77_019174 [Diaphorina citri]